MRIINIRHIFIVNLCFSLPPLSLPLGLCLSRLSPSRARCESIWDGLLSRHLPILVPLFFSPVPAVSQPFDTRSCTKRAAVSEAKRCIITFAFPEIQDRQGARYSCCSKPRPCSCRAGTAQRNIPESLSYRRGVLWILPVCDLVLSGAECAVRCSFASCILVGGRVCSRY